MQRGHALQLSAVALIAACGGADPVVVAPTHKHSFARHKGSTTRAADAGVPDGGEDSTPKQVIVMPPAAGPFVLLYPEEREAVRARVLQRIATLESGVLTPWSDEKMRTLAARVSAGKLRENGPICARPPTLVEVVDAETHGGADDDVLVATPSLDCNGVEECTIQVSVGSLEGERNADLMLSSKVSADAANAGVAAWLTAADALEEVDELVGYGFSMGSGAPPPFVRATLRKIAGDFGSTFTASPSLPPSSALAACHDASLSRRDNFSYDVLLNVDASGRSSKCAVIENQPDVESSHTKRDACICQAAQKTKFPPDANGAKNKGNGESRRVLFNVIDSPQSKKHPHKASVEARVNVLEGAGHPEASELLDIPQLSDCFLESNPKDDLTFDMKLHLAPTGKVEAVEIAAVPNQMRACLTRAFLATPFVCDMDGQARVLDAGVTLSLRSMASKVRNNSPNEGDDPR